MGGGTLQVRRVSSNPLLAHLMTLSALLCCCLQNEVKVNKASSQQPEHSSKLLQEITGVEVNDYTHTHTYNMNFFETILSHDVVMHNGITLNAEQDVSFAKQSSYLARTNQCNLWKRQNSLTKRTSHIPES